MDALKHFSILMFSTMTVFFVSIVSFSIIVLFLVTIIMLFFGATAGNGFIDVINSTVVALFNDNKPLFGWLSLIVAYYLKPRLMKLTGIQL